MCVKPPLWGIEQTDAADQACVLEQLLLDS